MHREPFQNQLRRSFIGYVAAILALILLLYLGGFALNFFAVVVRGCRRDNQELETALTQQLAAYDRGAEELTGADALRRAVGSGERGECLEANRLLYDFTNQQKLRAYFVLLGAVQTYRSVAAGSCFMRVAAPAANADEAKIDWLCALKLELSTCISAPSSTKYARSFC